MGWSLKNLIDPTGLIVGGGLSGDGEGLFGGHEGIDPIDRPKYYEDKDYRETQDYLKKFGMGILDGDIPDYYKGIGETGGSEFEKMMGLTTRDIEQSAAEASAKSGRARGGSLAATTSGAVADAAVKARYSDFTRAMSGKERLLSLGTGVVERTRTTAEAQGRDVNAFNWDDYNAQVAERAYKDQKEAAEDAALGEMIGTIASVGLGAATGGMSFGLQGAMAGGLDAFTGGGTSFLSTLSKNKRASAGVSSLGSISDDEMFNNFMFGGNN